MNVTRSSQEEKPSKALDHQFVWESVTVMGRREGALQQPPGDADTGDSLN